MKMKRTIRIDLWGWIALCVMAASWAAPPAHGQNSSLHRRQAFEASRSPLDPFPAEDVPLTLKDASWTHAPLPPPREIQKHDIISVRVDLLARMQADGELRRRKNARYDARLNDWIIFNGLRWVKPSPQSDGDPRTRGELRSEYRSLGELETSESLAFNLAVEVVDIRPNGNLVLEGRSQVILNDEMWTYVLSGLCRPESIGPNNVVLSRDIINLDIRKVETGSVAAGYQRGWFQKIFDLIQPF
jgi:flagellar L-ring protein FlgH